MFTAVGGKIYKIDWKDGVISGSNGTIAHLSVCDVWFLEKWSFPDFLVAEVEGNLLAPRLSIRHRSNTPPP